MAMLMSAEYMSNFETQQWCPLHTSEKFSSGTNEKKPHNFMPFKRPFDELLLIMSDIDIVQ